jgi:hypothetical protein
MNPLNGCLIPDPSKNINETGGFFANIYSIFIFTQILIPLPMNNQTRKIIRIVSIVIVLIVVFIQLDVLNINWAVLTENKIWLLIIAYFMLLISARG